MKKIEDFGFGNSKGTLSISIGAVVLMLVVYTVTCYLLIDKSSDTSEKALADTNMENSIDKNLHNNTNTDMGETTINVAKSSDRTNHELPVPNSKASVEWECGTYYSDISKTNMEAYLASLSKAGWTNLEGKEIDRNIIDGTTGYSLVKEDHILQFITYLMDPGVAICNSILVYYDENASLYKMQSREGAIQKSEAQERIQIQVDELSKQGKIPFTKDVVTGLFELAIDNAYDEFQLQAYAAISDMGFTGCFLIRKGVTTYVPGTLVNALVIDIDGDGNYELLDVYESWEGNTYRLEFIAYEYGNPDYFSSLTEILLQKYYSCYVPVDGYDMFRLVKEEKDRVSLVGETKVYGTVKIKDNTLCIIEEKSSVFLPWDISFDQSRLQKIKKTIPTTPVDITITYGESKLDYTVQETNWEGKKEEASIADTLKQILGKNQDLPRISLNLFAPDYDSSKIIIDFGDSMPDTIKVYDSMLDDSGGVRYNLSIEQTVQIINDRSVGFPLSQHVAYGLSSNSGDYEKDWRRLFQVICTWEENECTYSFLINTGKKKQLGNLEKLLN